ncbi:MAG: MarR family transcriptional regulator [Tissierellia bacterium]|jgi:DNA-binding MarR family transcriptional regulator|nr:MarR family transcriptional regulator [Tissierellia bacterium]
MKICEDLIECWIRLSALIWNNRITKELTYYEATILRELIRQNGNPINATALTKKSGMKKPQMHRILRSLEDRGFIVRETDSNDRRSQNIWIHPSAVDVYYSDHNRVLSLLSIVVEEAGDELVYEFIDRADRMAEFFNYAQEIINREG